MKPITIILGIGGVIGTYLLLDKLLNSTAEASEVPANIQLPSLEQLRNSEASTQATISQRTGPLAVYVNLRASALEKALANVGDLQKDLLKSAVKIGQSLPTACPGAPKLLGSPTVSLVKINEGFRATITWNALWGGTKAGPVQEVVRNCLVKQIKAFSPEAKNRFISLTANRLLTDTR